MILPADGNVTLEQLTQAIQAAEQSLGVADAIEVRSLLAPHNGRLTNAATLVRVGRGDRPDKQIEEIKYVDPIVLVS
jgi:hypothetical protein